MIESMTIVLFWLLLNAQYDRPHAIGTHLKPIAKIRSVPIIQQDIFRRRMALCQFFSSSYRKFRIAVITSISIGYRTWNDRIWLLNAVRIDKAYCESNVMDMRKTKSVKSCYKFFVAVSSISHVAACQATLVFGFSNLQHATRWYNHSYSTLRAIILRSDHPTYIFST